MGYASPLNEEDSYEQGTWGLLHVPRHVDLAIRPILPDAPGVHMGRRAHFHRSVRLCWRIPVDFMAWLGHTEE
jgi:hypothetical protein